LDLIESSKQQPPNHLSIGTESMNDFRLPRDEMRAELPCTRQSKAQQSRRSTASIAVGLVLRLAMLSASARPAAAEATVGTNDVPSALTDHWSLGTQVSYGKLQGDAANSPVTTDKTQRCTARPSRIASESR
jgi:MltA-interacting protein MipA